MTAFELSPGPDGARYEGPHGPIDVPGDQEPHSTRISTPDGPATLAWGLLSQDRGALERGVRVEVSDAGAKRDGVVVYGGALERGVRASVGGRELVLRRDGRELHLADSAGAPRLAARRRRLGRVERTRPYGKVVASFKGTLSGEVADTAAPDEVAAAILLMVSGAAKQLERRVPLPLSPFAP